MIKGLYLHIPFCEHKCSYCDFYSVTKRDETDVFCSLLRRELELRAEVLGDYPVQLQSVFFGGGTPSLLRPQQMELLCSTIRTRFSIQETCEWTMECNPGTVSPQSLSAFKSTGLSRLSFGVQSFHAAELQFLERIHDAQQAHDAVSMAHDAGFDNVNIDLMFALPGQSVGDFERNLDTALTMDVQHISAYSLIYEEGTPLYAQLLRNEVIPQTEDVDLAMYEMAMQKLASAGFVQYEVSNFARPGFECRHNLCYWNADEYLAVGPSAHGYYNSTRYWNVRNLSTYLQTLEKGIAATLNSEQLTVSDKLFEYCFLSLRSKGIDALRLRNEFGVELKALLDNHLPWIIDEGYAIFDTRLCLSPKGYAQCDDISLQLIHVLEKHTAKQWRQIGPAPEQQTVDLILPS